MPRRRILALLLGLLLVAAGAAGGALLDADRWWPALAGAGAGLVVGGLLGLLLVRVDRRLRDGSEAQRLTGLPLVAHVPPPGSGETDRRRSEEAFRMLRAALALPQDGPATAASRTVAVTSAAPGEGKTTVAAGLARALARAGRPVIAVEADLRRPGLARALGNAVPEPGAAPLRGLTAAIVGGVPVVDLLVEIEPGLRLLPAGELPPNAPELLGSPDTGRVLAELAALDVTIVLDTAPLLPVADTRELLALGAAGRIVVVARPGVVDRAEVRQAVALLPSGPTALLAVSGRAQTPRSYDRYLRDATRD